MTKRLLTLLIAFFTFAVANAQQNWGGGVDDEQLHFGFTFQYVSAEYKIFKKSDWRIPRFEPDNGTMVTDSLFSLSSPTSPGFGLGFVTDYRLGDNANLRFTPALVFTDRLLDYNYSASAKPEFPDPSEAGGSFIQKKVQATMIDLPLAIKLKSDRRKNFRAYMLAGAKYSLDIVSKKKLDDQSLAMSERLVKNTRSILWYEAAIGFDLYFEFFKLSPELKLSNSVKSVLKPESHPFSAPIDKLFLRNLQFSLYFE